MVDIGNGITASGPISGAQASAPGQAPMLDENMMIPEAFIPKSASGGGLRVIGRVSETPTGCTNGSQVIHTASGRHTDARCSAIAVPLIPDSQESCSHIRHSILCMTGRQEWSERSKFWEICPGADSMKASGRSSTGPPNEPGVVA